MQIASSDRQFRSFGWSSLAALVIAAACQNTTEATRSIEGTRRLSVGATTACALDPAGIVYCWGLNSSFLEYGTSAIQTSATPIAIPTQPLTSLGSGWGQHKCGLTDAEAVCWGRGTSG